MNTDRHGPGFLRVVAAAIAVVSFGVGCGPIDHVGGVWTVETTAIKFESQTRGPSGCDLTRANRLELVLGQYGEGVAGLVKLPGSLNSASDATCCTPIEGGVMVDGTLGFSFSFRRDSASGPEERFHAELTFHPSKAIPTLNGSLYVSYGDVTEKYAELELEGTPTEEVSRELRRCAALPCPGLFGEGGDTSGGGVEDVGEGADADR